MMTVAPASEAIGILLYQGAQLAAIHGLTDLLMLGRQSSMEAGRDGAAGFEISHWSLGAYDEPERVCVYSSEPGGGRAPGILIVPPTMVDLPDPDTRARIVEWIQAEHARGVLLVSICSGVVFLAESGLVDGRTVSTHRTYADFITEHYPAVAVDVDERIIEYPDVLTAGGFMSWVDVGLLLVQRLLGDRARDETATFMFSDTATSVDPAGARFLPPLSHSDPAVQKAQEHVHLNDGQGVSLMSMAAAARLERRTFIRRFTTATGSTPAAYCRAVRMARARELLEAGNLPQKEIAARLGYVDVSSFARAFRRVEGVAPGSYRKHFGGAIVRETDREPKVRPVDRRDPSGQFHASIS